MKFLQKTTVIRQETKDGQYKITAPIGTEVYVEPASIRVMKSWLAMRIAETEHFIPVELLNFTNEFKQG